MPCPHGNPSKGDLLVRVRDLVERLQRIRCCSYALKRGSDDVARVLDEIEAEVGALIDDYMAGVYTRQVVYPRPSLEAANAARAEPVEPTPPPAPEPPRPWKFRNS